MFKHKHFQVVGMI